MGGLSGRWRRAVDRRAETVTPRCPAHRSRRFAALPIAGQVSAEYALYTPYCPTMHAPPTPIRGVPSLVYARVRCALVGLCPCASVCPCALVFVKYLITIPLVPVYMAVCTCVL